MGCFHHLAVMDARFCQQSFTGTQGRVQGEGSEVFTSDTNLKGMPQNSVININNIIGTSLAVQWLGLLASTAGCTGLIPDRGTKIPQAAWCGQKKKKKKDIFYFKNICQKIPTHDEQKSRFYIQTPSDRMRGGGQGGELCTCKVRSCLYLQI